MPSAGYEAAQKILQWLFDEVETDSEMGEDSDSSLDDDYLEIQEEDSDSEQDIDDDFKIEHILQRRASCVLCLIGKDGTQLRKHSDQNS